MPQQGYIGRNPGDGRTIINRQTSHVTTGVQTSFTMTTGYDVGFLDVYLNGIKQTETLDYTAADGSTINFSPSFAPMNGDVLEFVAFETLNITNIKSARRNFSVGQDLDVSGNVTIGSSLTVASDLVVNGTFTTINTEILDVEDKTVGIASTSSPSNTTADGAGIVIYGGSDGDKSLTWNSTKSNFVLVGGGVSIGTGVTISTPAANVLAFSVNSAEKARFNNFGAFTVGYEGEAWHESTYVGVLQAGSGAWIGQTPGASARAEWTNNAYYDSVNTRWEYIAADEANRIVLENGELKVQSADAGSADGAITWNEKLKMTVGGDFKIGAPTGIGITISSSGNVDSIGIVTCASLSLGTNSPAANLAIHETSTSSASSQLMRITTANGALFGIETDETVSNPTWKIGGVVNSGTAEPLAFYQIGSEKFRLDSGGRFLIGDSTARAQDGGNNAQLQVSSATGGNWARISSSSFTSGDDIGGGLILTKSRSGTVGVHTVVANGDKLGSIFFEGSDGTDYERGAHIEAFVDGAPGDNDMPGRLVFSTTPDGSVTPAERMRITSSGALLLGTTTTPNSNKCSLRAAYLGSTSSGNVIELTHQTNGADKAGASIGLAIGNGGESTNAADLFFDTAISGSLNRRMTIKDSGKIGINETSPDTQLHITAASGDTILTLQRSDTNTAGLTGGINFAASDGHSVASIQARGDGDNEGADLRFYTTSDAAGDMFNAANVERMRIKSDGKVGIGEDNPSQILHLSASSGDVYNRVDTTVNGGMLIYVSGTQRSVFANDSAFSGTTTDTGIGAKGNLIFRAGTSAYYERLRIASTGVITNTLATDNTTAFTLRNNGTTGGHALKLTTGGTGAGTHIFSIFSHNQSSEIERLRVDANGHLMLGTGTYTNYGGRLKVFSSAANDACANFINTATGGTNRQIDFYFGSSTSRVGSIQSNSSATAFNTSSDYRLKENAVAISDGITRLKTLKPYRFNFKIDASRTVDGFFAHEVTAVPEAITGTKDEVVTQAMVDSGDYDSSKLNDPLYQEIDQSKLVPLLTAALQEAITKIETLETENTDLKNLIKNSSSFAALKSSL